MAQNNEAAHIALDRVGVKKDALPLRVIEAAMIIEAQRMTIRTLREELDKALSGR